MTVDLLFTCFLMLNKIQCILHVLSLWRDLKVVQHFRKLGLINLKFIFNGLLSIDIMSSDRIKMMLVDLSKKGTIIKKSLLHMILFTYIKYDHLARMSLKKMTILNNFICYSTKTSVWFYSSHGIAFRQIEHYFIVLK